MIVLSFFPFEMMLWKGKGCKIWNVILWQNSGKMIWSQCEFGQSVGEISSGVSTAKANLQFLQLFVLLVGKGKEKTQKSPEIRRSVANILCVELKTPKMLLLSINCRATARLRIICPHLSPFISRLSCCSSLNSKWTNWSRDGCRLFDFCYFWQQLTPVMSWFFGVR